MWDSHTIKLFRLHVWQAWYKCKKFSVISFGHSIVWIIFHASKQKHHNIKIHPHHLKHQMILTVHTHIRTRARKSHIYLWSINEMWDHNNKYRRHKKYRWLLWLMSHLLTVRGKHLWPATVQVQNFFSVASIHRWPMSVQYTSHRNTSLVIHKKQPYRNMLQFCIVYDTNYVFS